MTRRGTPDVQMVFDAIASPVRREILWLLRAEELAVGEIGAHFDLSGPTLSSHLTALRAADLVTMRVDGNFRRYRCNHGTLEAVLPLLTAGDRRWEAADDIPERGLATAATSIAVTISVETSASPAEAFAAFADGQRYSEWLGVPVTIDGGRFRTTLEWGTQIRGTYEVLSAPDLIAMRWDFDDDDIPLPGRELVAYLRVHPTASGSQVIVHQLAADRTQTAFLVDAWSMVLGRFAQAHADGAAAPTPRPARPNRRRAG